MSIRIAIALAFVVAATAASADERRVSQAAARAACMPDAVRLCRDAMPNVRNVVVCFLSQRSKLSNRCSAVLVSYGL